MADLDKKIEDFEALAARLEEEYRDAEDRLIAAQRTRHDAAVAFSNAGVKLKLLEAERDGIKPGDAVWVGKDKLAFMGFRPVQRGSLSVEPYFHKLKKDGKPGKQFVHVHLWGEKMQKVED